MGLLTQLKYRLFPWTRPLSAPDADPTTEVDVCLREHVQPALESVRDQLAQEGYQTDLEVGDDGEVKLSVRNFNDLPLIYAVRGHVYKEPVVNITSMADSGSLNRFSRIEVQSGGKTREYPSHRCRREDIEKRAMAFYRTFLMRTPEGG